MKHIRSMALVLLAGLAGLAQAANVTPPPLPKGSERVKVAPGLNPTERARSNRAHSEGRVMPNQGKGPNQRSYLIDDSIGKGLDMPVGTPPAAPVKR
jgi:hypothetical protein